jgi:hypothetical protein
MPIVRRSVRRMRSFLLTWFNCPVNYLKWPGPHPSLRAYARLGLVAFNIVYFGMASCIFADAADRMSHVTLPTLVARVTYVTYVKSGRGYQVILNNATSCKKYASTARDNAQSFGWCTK